jgi:FKBP-type peptidyl-prolyl cis-trans isomerase SlyD
MAVNNVERIEDGVVVSLAYTLTVDGTVVETASADAPLEYLHGAENLVPGLERALTNKMIGDKFSITLQPEDAYGDYDEDDIETIDRNEFPDDETLEPGMVVVLEDEDGYEVEAIVSEVTSNAVVLDFNPPLAGKTVTYTVEVVELREADEEELEQGYPFGDELDYDDDHDHNHN